MRKRINRSSMCYSTGAPSLTKELQKEFRMKNSPIISTPEVKEVSYSYFVYCFGTRMEISQDEYIMATKAGCRTEMKTNY